MKHIVVTEEARARVEGRTINKAIMEVGKTDTNKNKVGSLIGNLFYKVVKGKILIF